MQQQDNQNQKSTSDKEYNDLLARLGIKPKKLSYKELLEEIGESLW
jgi:hypothetical protein